MFYVNRWLTSDTCEKLHLNPEMVEVFQKLFQKLSETRQIHLNSVTHLAHQLMQLRMNYESSYPVSGTRAQQQLHLIKLLLAYNLHDIGDLPVEITENLLDTPETALRREQIQQGDWISLGEYAAEKFNAPIRGYIITRALHLAIDKNSELSPPDKILVEQLGIDPAQRCQLNPHEHELLDLIAFVAYHHHEYYDGKGWPRGVKLNPHDATMDVTFFDFIAGWFVNKMTRGANPIKITASTPAQVLEAIDQRQAESLRRTPGGEPMYNRFWVKFMREHLAEVTAIVVEIFPDVKQQTG